MNQCLRLFLFAILLISVSTGKSQQQENGRIAGTLTDSAGGVPVSYATVAVFDTRDSSVVNFALSDDQGGFELNRLPIGAPLRLLVSHLLYHPVIRNFSLDTSGYMELDTFRLIEKKNELAESVITWEAPPIVIRNDTVEFNADAFVGRPGSAVEDLLKRIPGVDIDESGNITVNGREVTKITIDSKDFFANDPLVLLRNIPAKAIEKVQVTEEKDERGQLLHSGNVTINLTLKHWAKKSHFGKVYAGYGTDGRYEAGGMWNFLRDTLQISVLGYGNNLSQAGFSFSDLYQMGGFNRNGIRSFVQYDDGRIEANGLNLGGGKGISESGGGGFNLNYDIPGKLKLNTSYFMGFNRTKYLESTITERYFGDSTLALRRSTDNLLKNSTHVINGEIRWIPDTIQFFNLEPTFRWEGSNDIRKRTDFNAYLSSPESTQIFNQNTQQSGGYSFDNYLSWNWKKRKNNLVVYGSQAGYNTHSDGLNDYLIIEQTDTSVTGSPQLQTRDSYNKSISLNTTFKHTYTLSDSVRLYYGVTHDYRNGLRNVEVYARDSASSPEFFQKQLSTEFYDNVQTWTGVAGINRSLRKGFLAISVSGGFSDYRLRNALNDSAVNSHFSLFNPNISYEWNKSGGNYHMEYEYEQELPASWQMIDLVDNTDPNRVSRGNPALQASNRHRLSYYGRWNNSKRTMGFYSSAGASAATRTVVDARSFDESGRSVTQPVNLDDGRWTYSVYARGHYYLRTGRGKTWSHSPNIRAYVSQRWGWTSLNGTLYENRSLTFYPRVGYSLHKNDFLDASVSYSPSYQYSLTPGLNSSSGSLNQRYELELWIAPFEKLWFEGKCSYNRQNFTTLPDSPTEFTLLNLAVTRLILRENRGQLRLSVYDLLHQNQNSERTSEENALTVSNVNAVTRYYMLSFVYNFHSFNTKGSRRRGIQFWW